LPRWSEKQTRHAYSGLLHIPLTRNVLERHIECSPLPRAKRRIAGIQREVRLAQRYLIHVVVEHDRQFDFAQRALARIKKLARDNSDLLIEKIFRPAQRYIFNFDLEAYARSSGPKGGWTSCAPPRDGDCRPGHK